MEQFIEDVKSNLGIYYDQFVDLAPKLLLGLIVLAIIWFLANKIRNGIRSRLATRLDDPLLSNFLGRVSGILIKLIGLMIFLKIIGLGGSVAAFLGAASIGTFVIGFALKDIGEHFLAGIVLAFNRPFRIGDTIEVSGNIGKVSDISLRNTHIKSFDGKDIYIPNGDIIKNPLTNYTMDGFIRTDFNVGIAYDADAQKAINIIKDILEDQPGILTDSKEPTAYVTALADSAVEITVYYWINPLDPATSGFTIKSNLLQAINQHLTAAGIEIPYNIINIIPSTPQI